MLSVATSRAARAGEAAKDTELAEKREDREWLDKRHNAKPESYLSAKESLAFVRRIAN